MKLCNVLNLHNLIMHMFVDQLPVSTAVDTYAHHRTRFRFSSRKLKYSGAINILHTVPQQKP
jgi:hypothetical protein